MFETILVPLDGSTLAETALPYAAALARHFEAQVILVRSLSCAAGEPVLDSNSDHQANAVYPEQFREAWDYLRLARQTPPLYDVPVKIAVLEGEPAQTIIEAADRFEADVIVMATHGRGGVARWVMGSVADEVLRGATVPVLLARARVRHERPSLSALLRGTRS
ncbi:MAG TPA: hypothetical protein DEP84_34700 [Chloroflexi bacterium]|nr:hypothetical protein [Chloroflexota bacterium]